MSTAEIAGILGRSEGAVRVLIHRALRSVARDLAGRATDGRPADGAPGEADPTGTGTGPTRGGTA